MFVFKDDHLVLDNQLVCSLVSSISPILHFTWLSIALSEGLRHFGSFPVQFGMLIDPIILQLTLRSHVDETVQVQLLMLLRI